MKRFLSLVTACALLLCLTACGEPSRTTPLRPNGTPSTRTTDAFTASTTTASPTNAPLPKLELDEQVTKIISSQVSFTDADVAALRQALDFTVTFPYSEHYGVLESYEKYLALPAYTSTHENYFADGVFTAEELFAIVKENNTAADFVQNKRIGDAQLKRICNTIAPLLKEYGVNASDQAARRLSEKIADLEVFQFSGFAYGSYDAAENQLGVDLSREHEERYDRTLYHETFHLIQGSTPAENAQRGIYARYGESISFEDAESEPLNFRWFHEGCAEALTHDYVGDRAFDTYDQNIYYMDVLKNATIWREDVGVTTLEELSLETDIEPLFNYFGCATDDDRREVLEMMCALNYYFDMQSCGDVFYDTVGDGLTTNKFRFMIAEPFGLFATRHFYESFGEALCNQTVSVEEVFLANALFEHTITDRIYWQDNTPFRMVEQYHHCQTALMEVLAAKLSLSVDDVQTAYDTYFENGVFDASKLTRLPQEKRDYLQAVSDDAVNPPFRSMHRFYLSGQ